MPGTGENHLIIKKEQLSNDYFVSCEDNMDYFFVPMGQYPLNYRIEEKDKWDLGGSRKKSIFMTGNMDSRFYYKIENFPIFSIVSRRRVYDYLICANIFMKIKSFNDLNNYISGEADNGVILIDTQNDFSIDFQNLKKITREFNFYLALPGTIIPYCHNLIEAMSVGCIPIIQRSYAKSLHPELVNGENSLFFETLEGLDEVIRKSFNLSDSEILRIRANVLDYYNSHLTASSVIERIENKKFNKIFIQGGWCSIEKAISSLQKL
ncbi:hypothetical protein GCM10007103_34020 [Salinimicrobium marinum]|uniref:Exostosin family protein n=1 Tax=Salinimicrobium marinum TaxID=680283 RepID=A0A918SLN5_9FLAO|nr:hypothetical protein [Salinimicrobium marinum]GHA50432.1 hypothetical protein GCM10007103_34020 [Salinimicrobium marinum]